MTTITGAKFNAGVIARRAERARQQATRQAGATATKPAATIATAPTIKAQPAVAPHVKPAPRLTAAQETEVEVARILQNAGLRPQALPAETTTLIASLQASDCRAIDPKRIDGNSPTIK